MLLTYDVKVALRSYAGCISRLVWYHAIFPWSYLTMKTSVWIVLNLGLIVPPSLRSLPLPRLVLYENRRFAYSGPKMVIFILCNIFSPLFLPLWHLKRYRRTSVFNGSFAIDLLNHLETIYEGDNTRSLSQISYPFLISSSSNSFTFD